jgi:3-hydroxyacyl-CoA dehydrogenase/enoyl-CoA hydratase/3-hydroxybutyryl-CoA epimerase
MASKAQPQQTPSPATSSPGSLTRDEHGIAWLALDDPAKKVNTLSSRFFAWFEEVVGGLEQEPPAGLVILSGKPDGFVAGADLEELLAVGDKEAVIAMLERGHDLMQRIAGLRFPTVAAIHGACLGGGLELALACRYRVATEHRKTKLGLPEVQLGLIPGLGGTQRLPRLIGVPAALDLILTGKQLDAKRARKAGLVDDTCHPADLGEAARRWAGKAREEKKSPAGGIARRATDLLAKTPLADRLIFDKARAETLAKTGGHYPAPLVAIDVVHDGLKLPLRRALDVEAGAFSELVVSDTAKSLISIFFTKNEVEARAARIAKGARPLPQIGVLGAGFMGAGIAQVLAAKGVSIVLKDKDLAALGRGLGFCAQQLRDLVKRRRLTEVEAKGALGHIHGTVAYDASFHRLPLVIEAVFEDVKVKHGVIRETEAAAPEDLIFASNTSAIPIGRLAEASRRPENVVGMHFFSPVAKMPLVEVIRHAKTSDAAVAAVVEAGRIMGKTVIVVNDGPGFFTSRVLGTMLNEAAWMLVEGASIQQIDGAMTAWGWPVGPFALLDEVGLDVGAHVAEIVREALGERLDPPPVFARMIADKRLGRKGKRGFYVYAEDGGKKKDKEKKEKPVDESVYRLIGWQAKPITDAEIVERCWMQMLNETARCMEEGIITNPADVDLGVIFGFGFPPFRGGLLREADRVGLATVVERLNGYAARFGKRLEPAELLRKMARNGESFYEG